jgi:hypothetical protein
MKLLSSLAPLAFPAGAMAPKAARTGLGLTVNTINPIFAPGNLRQEEKFLDGGELRSKSLSVGLLGRYFLK